MAVKSVFSLISVYKAKLTRKDLSGTLDTKGVEPTFQVWDGEKKGEPKFFKILGGTKALHTMAYEIPWNRFFNFLIFMKYHLITI